jgi:predicted esterase
MKYLLPLLILITYFYFKNPIVKVPYHNIEFSYRIEHVGDKSSKDKLPMLIALHGDGSSPEDFYKNALGLLRTPVRVILIKGPKRRDFGHTWPNIDAKYDMPLSVAVNILISKYKTIGKPILLGFSSGAIMANHQAIIDPDTYSYIFSISGSLRNSALDLENKYSDLEVISYHGENDDTIAFQSGKSASENLKKSGLKTIFIPFEGGHNELFTTIRINVTNHIEEKLKVLVE